MNHNTCTQLPPTLLNLSFDEHDPMPQQVRSYQVEEILGQGGMSVVYLATHELLSRPVAIKRYVFTRNATPFGIQLERFLREGKALAQLRHQGIVGIYDLFEHRGQMYMILEYVDGAPISTLLAAGPLPLDIACMIGLRVAEALDHCHFHGILHRDIKPTNVMVAKSGQVKLMDFGIARGTTLKDVTRTGMVVGTPMYLAPEVLMGREATPGTDIYGLGMLLYQCFSGKRAYEYTSEQNLYFRIVSGQYKPLQKVIKGIPRPICDLVHTCLAHDPGERFQSAADVAAELSKCMSKLGFGHDYHSRLAAYVRVSPLFDESHTSRTTAVRSMDIQPVQTPDCAGEEVCLPAPSGRVWPRVLLALLLFVLLGCLLWQAKQQGWMKLPLLLSALPSQSFSFLVPGR